MQMDTSNCAHAKICILQFASSKVGATFDFNTHPLIKILLFATIPCVTMCDLMSPTITNGCLCDYFSKLDGFLAKRCNMKRNR
jgi:hypothetical protein